MLLVGIDPGVKTGFCMINADSRKVEMLATLKIHDAMDIVRGNKDSIYKVFIEDPNMWTHFTDKNAKKRLQGAGSVKRDFGIWKDFLEAYGIKFIALRPDKRRNEFAYNIDLFKKISGHEGRCSEHARVAYMLISK